MEPVGQKILELEILQIFWVRNATTTSQNIYFRFHNIYNNRYDKFFEAWEVNALLKTLA